MVTERFKTKEWKHTCQENNKSEESQGNNVNIQGRKKKVREFKDIGIFKKGPFKKYYEFACTKHYSLKLQPQIF